MMKFEHFNHSSPLQSQRIFELFQLSYAVEAKLVECDRFPPLERSAQEIAAADTKFLSLSNSDQLIGLLEFKMEEEILDICSLVIHPQFFRKGLGYKLTQYLLNRMDWKIAKVETARANLPAIALYEKLRFRIKEEYQAKYNIWKVKMLQESS